MAQKNGTIDEPQSNTSTPQTQQETNNERLKDGIKEKVFIALISSVLSIIVGYCLHFLTTDEPNIIMINRPAFPQFTLSRVMHVVTIKK